MSTNVYKQKKNNMKSSKYPWKKFLSTNYLKEKSWLKKKFSLIVDKDNIFIAIFVQCHLFDIFYIQICSLSSILIFFSFRDHQIRFRCALQNTVLDVLQARPGWQEVLGFVFVFNILLKSFLLLNASSYH